MRAESFICDYTHMINEILGKCQINAFPPNAPFLIMFECSQKARDFLIFSESIKENIEEMSQTIQTFHRMLISSLDSDE